MVQTDGLECSLALDDEFRRRITTKGTKERLDIIIRIINI